MKPKTKQRGRPRKICSTQGDANDNLDLGDKLLDQFKIKHCSVKLTPINIEKSAMDETSPAPVIVPKRRGRKPKNAQVPKNDETPSKPVPSSDDKNDEKNDTNASLNESTDNVEKPVKKTLSERKQAKKAAIEAIIASGGRGKRTPKPNPKYMDEPSASASKRRDDNDFDNPDAEDGDDEMNQSSDERRHEGPLKKRMLQKTGIKSGPGRKPGSGKGTPGRKPAAAGFKRKLEVDIDIDDEHGKQLFLDAKRRFQNSPSCSDDDLHLKKSKSPVTDALAAKLRSKFPNDFTVKRTIENKVSPVNRARLLEKSKIIVHKEGGVEVRKRQLTEDTETSEDDIGAHRGASDQEASSQKNNSRRKTHHTKILSDDKTIRDSPSSSTTIVRKSVGGTTVVSTKQINKSPLAQNQLIQSKLSAAKTYSISSQSRVIGSNKPAILRQPPRILNSTLCKPSNKPTVPSLVTKVVTKDDFEHDLNKKRNNNVISSKENNVTSYVYTEKDGKMIPKKTVVQLSPQQKLIHQRKAVLPVVRTAATQQRIISEPVTNIPNTKRIRKITCFETWYVIKMVEEQPKVEKSILNLSLMQIGNEIKKIELPSSDWTYKILLQPLNKQLLAMRKTKVIEKAKESDDSKTTTAAKTTTTPAAATTTTTESETETPKDSDDSKNIESDTNDVDKKGKKNVKRKKNSTESESEKSPKEEVTNAETTDDDDDKKNIINEKPEEKAEEQSEEEKSDEKSDIKSEDSSEEKPDIKDEDKSEDSEQKSEDNPENQSNEESTKDEQKSDDIEKTEGEDSTPKTEPEQTHDVYTGEVHDPNLNPDERHNYRPINIMFRRKCQNPNIRIQFDRTVILKNQTFYLNVDGKNVRLIASPQTIETYDDIKTLLQIVNDVSLNSCCVEPATHVA